MSEKPDISLSERIFRILDASNEGFYQAFAKVDDGIVSVFYDYGSRNQRLFEVDLREKTLHFSSLPRSYLTEQECIDLAKELKERGYEIRGLMPKYEPNQISLY